MIMVVEQAENDCRMMVECVRMLYPKAEIVSFQDPMLAFQYAFQHRVDMLFSQAEMPRLSGFSLAKMIRRSQPNLQFYLSAKNEEEENDVMRVMAAGCVRKPITLESVREAINNED